LSAKRSEDCFKTVNDFYFVFEATNGKENLPAMWVQKELAENNLTIAKRIRKAIGWKKINELEKMGPGGEYSEKLNGFKNIIVVINRVQMPKDLFVVTKGGI
jgi:hypothetical protein